MPGGVPVEAEWVIYSHAAAAGRLHQGEILEGVREWVPAYTHDGSVEGARAKVHPLAIVMTQDCDLEQDWRTRERDPVAEGQLMSVLFCQVVPETEIRARDGLNSKVWQQVRQNNSDRYQYLDAIPVSGGPSREPMVVDFKKYFSVRTAELYRQLRSEVDPALQRRAILLTPWREHFQARFTSHLGRIGLPREHFVAESKRAEAVVIDVASADPALPPTIVAHEATGERGTSPRPPSASQAHLGLPP